MVAVREGVAVAVSVGAGGVMLGLRMGVPKGDAMRDGTNVGAGRAADDPQASKKIASRIRL